MNSKEKLIKSEKLLSDYIDENGLATHLEGYNIESIEVAGDLVMFEERSNCGNYVEIHKISMLDIMSWLYVSLLQSGAFHDRT